METKICSKCLQEKTIDMFGMYLNKVNSQCRACRNETTKQWKEKNKQHIKEYNKNYGQENAEKISSNSKIYREKNSEKIKKYNLEYKKEHKNQSKEYNEQYRKENKIKLQEYAKTYGKKYYKTNKNVILDKNKKYYIANKERIQKQHKEYHLKNKDWLNCKKRKKSKQRYIENKERISHINSRWKIKNRDKCNITQHKRRSAARGLESNMTKQEWEQCKLYFDYLCAYCGESKPLTQDHFVAVKNGGEYTKNNIIPACKSCNSSKQDTDFFEWYPKQNKYSKKRQMKILEYLGYNGGVQQLKLIIN